jgi:surface polysaccharide O-acyltransferase-like enzyme
VTKRIDSLDTLKGLALLAVFFIHARGSFIDNYHVNSVAGFILINTARFAVPVFFLISGYLLHLKLQQKGRDYGVKYLKSVGKYYVLGSIIWLGIQLPILYLNRFTEVKSISQVIQFNLNPINIFYLGDAVSTHLWFLTALFLSTSAVYVADRFNLVRWLLGSSLIIHVIGILSQAYQVSLGIAIPRTDALFFGLFFTTAGFYIRGREPKLEKISSLLLKISALSIILHIVERLAISIVLNSSAPFQWSDYSFMTAPMAISIFLYTLSRPEAGEKSIFNRYGKHSLWGYILHPAFLGLLIAISQFLGTFAGLKLMDSILWSIIITGISYVITMEIISRDMNWKERIPEKITS